MVINDWLSTNVDSGEGNKKVTLTSTPNNTDEDRVTTLVVKGKNKSVSVNVRQLKQSVSEGFVFYVKHYSNIPVSGTNADRVLSVFSCNKPCTLIRYDIYTGQDLGMDFVTEETLEMAEGINNIYLNAESNIVDGVTNPIRFVAYVIVYEGKSYGYFPIAQLGIDPTITVTPNEVRFNEMGGTTTIEITANTNWRIGGDNYRPQITFSKTFGKSGTHTINVTAQEYEGIEDLIYNLWVGVGIDISVPLVIKQVIVGIPQNCFYVEPLTAEGTTITPDSSVLYLQNDVWNELTASNSITITDKTYIKNFNKVDFYEHLSLKGNCNVGGNIETLLGEMKVNYATIFFASSDIVDASNLILPATTLADGCYYQMFSGCVSLTTPPQLPATTLAENCYRSMFEDCISLVTTPQLPATTLAVYCYLRMFDNCTSLTTPPQLPATTLAENCYDGMFRGCTALVNAPALSATTLAKYCYREMFKGCTSLTTAPEELPATILTLGCYASMFDNCTSLTTAPKLPATELETECYAFMFYYCTSLNKIISLELDPYYSFNATQNWVMNVSPTGVFYKNPNRTDLTTGYSYIPEGWEVRDYDSGFEFSVDVDDIDLTHNLTATINVTSNTNWSVEYDGNWFSVSPTSGDGNGSITVTANGYNNNIGIKNGYISFISSNLEVYRVRIYQGIEPFEGCFYIEPNTSDNEVTVRLSVGIMDAYVYYFVDNEWRELQGDNPITINKRTYFKNYHRAYYNWGGFFIRGLCNIGGNIETLLGEMRDQYAYKLFENCDIVDASNLILPATTLGRLCYNDMFNGCSSLVNPPTLPATTLNQYCYEQMFYGCSSLNNITMLATNISADSCLENWVWGVSPTGIFYKNPNMNDLPTGNSGIPSGWEVRDYENNI